MQGRFDFFPRYYTALKQVLELDSMGPTESHGMSYGAS